MNRSHPVLLALGAAALLSACERGAATAQPLPAARAGLAASGARLVAPEPVRYAPQVVATGMLKPRQSAQLAFSVPGTLSRIAVKRGESVREGALLLALDDAAAGATVRQAEAAVAAAQAQLDLAEDGLRRITAIREKDGAAEAQVVQVKAQRDLASAQLAAARAQAEQARINLAHQSLRAPFAGLVTRVPDGVGSFVGPGTPVTGLSSTAQLYLETSLTQAEAAGLAPGTRVQVRVPASGASGEGSVAVVLGVVDPSTTRVPVEISVPNPDGRFLAGSFARAELPRGEERDAFKVPSSALVQREAGFAVWTAGADGRARAVAVRLLGEEAEASVVAPEDAALAAALAHVVESPAAALSEGARVAESGR